MHPEIGFYAFEEPVNWREIASMPAASCVEIKTPSKGVFIPDKINSFRIEANPNALNSLDSAFSGEESPEKIPFNLEKLMNGNRREMEKFLKFMEKHPELALRMAVPLDTLGSTRGSNFGKFVYNHNGKGGGFKGGLSIIIIIAVVIVFVIFIIGMANSGSFSAMPFLFIIIFFVRLLLKIFNESGSGRSSSSALLDSASFQTLQQRYEKLATGYIEKEEFHKAANIYLKLLKNHTKAAQTLEAGKYYQEAAEIYLKYAQDKRKAAECYEKGKIYTRAVDLYDELNEKEKVGDLYALMNNKAKADLYFRQVIDGYKQNSQYVKASLIYRKKIGDTSEAQNLLLDGWRTNKDASNCLNNYFANIADIGMLKSAINKIYTETDESRQEIFLHVIKHEYNKDVVVDAVVKNIAYEIISGNIEKNPLLASELIFFNTTNKTIAKDIMKYKLFSRKNIM